ncbi:MAG: SUMF1/EgtB/PvdO family nonheme iron enzyme [Alphaproteobacteria bacterium]|nr:SUMF1/EgtB/PvdO family nonheme iron enzyme [Alphaproteobacteria bacterium]
MPGGPNDLSSVSIALASLLRQLDGEAPPEAPDAREASTLDRGALPDRYEDMGLLGLGGMGEVRRVLDRTLNRPVAMKVIRPSMVYSPESMARFMEEAQLAAQLEHPGIVPVYEAGRLADGRLYFTMQEVRGRTLDLVIDEVHQSSGPDQWSTTRDGWSLRRLVDAFHRICEAMAYAHARGVIHRDLKPGNVMIGPFGEVLVLDWGLGKVLSSAGDTMVPGRSGGLGGGAVDGTDAVRTERSDGDAFQTRAGEVGGTVLYMPPEQARGEISELGPRSDVYALGAILFHVLGNAPPYAVATVPGLLRAQAEGLPEPPGRVAAEGVRERGQRGRPIPQDLWDICCRALSAEPGRRHRDAGTLADEVAEWLEGARRRERALAVVAEAAELEPRIDRLRADAARLRAQAEALLVRVPPLAPVRQKRPGWRMQEQAAGLEREAVDTEERMVETLHAALSHQPDLAEAHARLAAWYRRAHEEAIAAGDPGLARRVELRLRSHDDGTYAAWLSGDGRLTLRTEPPGADVVLHPLVERDRRLEESDGRPLGSAPLVDVPLPMGSYVLHLTAPGRVPVRYPVFIGRQQHWSGVGPDGRPRPILLPDAAERGAERLGIDDCYVPAGPARVGGDDEATHALPVGTVWIDGFVIQRTPVTNAAYIAFLDDLVAQGREDEALQWVPRERSARAGELGGAIYGRDDAGRFVLVPDAEGDTWQPEWPVVMVTWDAAGAYAAWWAARTGLPWRLPSELEWEKAARGVDGRVYPWGDHLDLTWCLLQDSHAGRMKPAVVSAFASDESVYGLRGAAGNVRDWCREAEGEGEAAVALGHLVDEQASVGDADTRRVSRGGCWYSAQRDARVGTRVRSPQNFRAAGVGFRLARSLG